MLGRCTLDLDPVDRGRSTVGGLGPRRYYDDTIIRGSVGSRPSSSYSLREIDPEQPSVAVIYIPDSDSKTIDGPDSIEMVIKEDPKPTSGIPASPTSLYEDSTSALPVSSPLAETTGSCSFVPCHSLEQGHQVVESRIATLQVELARTKTARVDRLAGEVAQMRRTLEYCLHLIDTEEHKTYQFVKRLRVELQCTLAPLPLMSLAATIETATRTEIADQMAKQQAVAMGAPSQSHKRSGQGRWRPKYSKKP
ncbi:hypothetical protein M9H77_14583 [Catharanthus roseus]|uniref:Uncharacterized protein n=1 Tax=Catharanthus roseus TaxID=4058 RepID=A0ACC0BNM0_CATRO|nr:hypothetical protein M9H77_14583 [Catharanthus roseus]